MRNKVKGAFHCIIRGESHYIISSVTEGVHYMLTYLHPFSENQGSFSGDICLNRNQVAQLTFYQLTNYISTKKCLTMNNEILEVSE